ncbi:MAG TPA: DUF4160 domain-containing protein [Terracidiphilus sp.]|jgi:hypothetical protein|nr:DUF4160 domain-containing protein [Terracidiphilus sp.]
MPTVLWIGSLRVVVYPNDHRRAHVHVIGQGHEAVFELNRPAGAVALRENYGFNRSDLSRIAKTLQQHMMELLAAWEKIHGTP